MKRRPKHPNIALLGGARRRNPNPKSSEPRPHGVDTLTRVTAKPKARMGSGPAGVGSYSTVVSKRPLTEMSIELAGITKQLGDLGVNVSPIINASSPDDVVEYMRSIASSVGSGRTEKQAMAASRARELAREALSVMSAARPEREPRRTSPRAASARLSEPISIDPAPTRKQRKQARAGGSADTGKRLVLLAGQDTGSEGSRMSRSARAIASASREAAPVAPVPSKAMQIASVRQSIERSRSSGVVAEITGGAFAGFSGPVSITGDGSAIVELTLMGKRKYVTINEKHIRLSKVARSVDPGHEKMHELVGKRVRVITGPLKNLRGDVVGERGSKLLVSFSQGVFEVRPKDIAEIPETKSNPGRYDIFSTSMRRA